MILILINFASAEIVLVEPFFLALLTSTPFSQPYSDLSRLGAYLFHFFFYTLLNHNVR